MYTYHNEVEALISNNLLSEAQDPKQRRLKYVDKSIFEEYAAE